MFRIRILQRETFTITILQRMTFTIIQSYNILHLQ